MREDVEAIPWEQSYISWKMYCEHFASPVLEGARFLQVRQQPSVYTRLLAPFDWWPKTDLAQRRIAVEQPLSFMYWETRRGTIHTVELLWNARNTIEEQHAILMLASLWDKRARLPRTWRGNVNRMVQAIEQGIRTQFPDLERWHHASREALPVSLTEHVYTDRMLVPEDQDEVMFVAALEAALAVANWQLVEYLESTT